jgi:glycosyltransferase involved in cell wall biosynthesis
MKVLQVINSFAPETGGAERLALQFHQAYLRQGIDSHLLSLMDVPVIDVPNTYSLGLHTPYQVSALLRLYAFLSRGQWKNVDVIHVHLFPAQFLVPIAAKLAGMGARLITTEHNTFNRRRRIMLGRIFDHFLYRFYRKIACISFGTRDTMAQWMPGASSKLVTIHNGIDLSMFSMNTCRRTFHNKTPIIVSAGRLTEQKNYETAIKAIGIMRDQPFEYWIAGKGELEAPLQELVRSLDLEDKVRFLGFRSDLPQLFQQADVFLLPSRWEGFGLAVAEAMAAGLPVVASDVPGLREVVGEEPRAGFMVDPMAPEVVARRLSELLENSELRSIMGRNAQRQASRFAIEKTIENYLQLYREVLRPQRDRA